MGDIQKDNILVVATVFASATNFADDTNISNIFDDVPPEWRNQTQQYSSIIQGSPNKLSAQGRDGVNLTTAILSTNESGT